MEKSELKYEYHNVNMFQVKKLHLKYHLSRPEVEVSLKILLQKKSLSDWAFYFAPGWVGVFLCGGCM